MRFDLRWSRPIVMGVVQIVPRHFVDTDRQNRLKCRVNSLIDQLGNIQLVNIEDGRVPVIEDQRLSKVVRSMVERLVTGKAFEQTFVQRE